MSATPSPSPNPDLSKILTALLQSNMQTQQMLAKMSSSKDKDTSFPGMNLSTGRIDLNGFMDELRGIRSSLEDNNFEALTTQIKELKQKTLSNDKAAAALAEKQLKLIKTQQEYQIKRHEEEIVDLKNERRIISDQRKQERDFFDLGFKKDRAKKDLLTRLFERRRAAKEEGPNKGEGFISSLFKSAVGAAYDAKLKDSVDRMAKLSDIVGGKVTSRTIEMEQARLKEKRESDPARLDYLAQNKTQKIKEERSDFFKSKKLLEEINKQPVQAKPEDKLTSDDPEIERPPAATLPTTIPKESGVASDKLGDAISGSVKGVESLNSRLASLCDILIKTNVLFEKMVNQKLPDNSSTEAGISGEPPQKCAMGAIISGATKVASRIASGAGSVVRGAGKLVKGMGITQGITRIGRNTIAGEAGKEVIAPLSKFPDLVRGMLKNATKNNKPLDFGEMFKGFKNLISPPAKQMDGSSSSADEVQNEAQEQFQKETIKINKNSEQYLEHIAAILKDVSNPTSHTSFTVRTKIEEQNQEKKGGSKEEKKQESSSFLMDLIKGAGFTAIISTLLAGAGVAAAAGTLYSSITATKAREELKENTMAREKQLRKGEAGLANIEEKRLGMKAGSLQSGLGTFEGAEEASKGLNKEQLEAKRDTFQMSATRTENRIKELERNKKLHHEKGIFGKASSSIFGMGFSGNDQKELEDLQKELMAKKASIGAVDAQLAEEKKKLSPEAPKLEQDKKEGIKPEAPKLEQDKKESIKVQQLERIPKETIDAATSSMNEKNTPKLLQDLISLVKQIGGDYNNIVKVGVQKASSSAVAQAAAVPTGAVDNVTAASGGVYVPAMSTMKS